MDSMNTIRSRAEVLRAKIKGEYELNLELLDEATQNLEAEVRAYIRTGVAYHRDKGFSWRDLQPDQTPRSFFASVASAANRPMLWAEFDTNMRAIELKAPSTKRMQPVVSSLIMISDEAAVTGGKWGRVAALHNADATVVRYHTGTNWRFYFKANSAGEEMFHQWRETCASSPVLRICLGVPPQ